MEPTSTLDAAARRSRRAAVLILLAAGAAALAATGAFTAPLAVGPASELLRAGYGTLCHQMPERSLTLGGRPFALCARCTGLALGVVAGLAVAARLARRGRLDPRPLWLVLPAASNGVDALLATFGGGGLANLPRLFLALPLGFAAALFLAHGLADLVARPAAGGAASWLPNRTLSGGC